MQEIAHALGWCEVVSARLLKRSPFPGALELDAREGVVAAEVRGVDADEQGTVGVFAVASERAHAIGDHAAGFGSSGYHSPAGTHAKGVDASAIAGVMDEGIVSCAQQWVACS